MNNTNKTENGDAHGSEGINVVISVVIIVPVTLIILAIVLVKKYGKTPVKVAAEP